jgi:hypothetical protein
MFMEARLWLWVLKEVDRFWAVRRKGSKQQGRSEATIRCPSTHLRQSVGCSRQFGTVCNPAARLCAEAKDGQIPTAQRVAVAVGEVMMPEEVGELTLKGLTQPVVAFNVPVVNANVVPIRSKQARACNPRSTCADRSAEIDPTRSLRHADAKVAVATNNARNRGMARVTASGRLLRFDWGPANGRNRRISPVSLPTAE